jgi:GxxExxY protein
MEVHFENVWSELGSGYSESVYQSALEFELQEYGVRYDRRPVNITYKGYSVGVMFTDLVVNNKYVVELKAVKKLTQEHSRQLEIYMKTLDIKDGYLVNFGNDLDVIKLSL